MADVVRPVIIDNGSHTCKAGFGGEKEPRIVFPTVVGYPLFPDGMVGRELNDYYKNLDQNKDVLNITHPIERGIITNWDDMEKIWRYTFKELKVASEESSVLLTETVFNSNDNRERMAKIMFETFNTRALCIANQALLSVFSSGYTTGLSVNIGHGITQIVPVSNGSIIRDAAVQWEFAGLDMTNDLMNMLAERVSSFGSHSRMEIVRNIKEKCCYVARDFEQEMQTAASERYKIPDKHFITIGNERFQTPEVMFQPRLFGKNFEGIHERIRKSIIKCDRNIRGRMFANIVLSGGSVMFPDFVKRMEKELSSILTNSTQFTVVVPTEWWPGNNALASLSTNKDRWISREEYNEYGPYILNKKCA